MKIRPCVSPIVNLAGKVALISRNMWLALTLGLPSLQNTQIKALQITGYE